MTTYAAFMSSLTGMTVTGVVRRYTAPPMALNTADLPASFPMLPAGDDTVLVFNATGGQQITFTCDLIFAYEPVAQNTTVANYSGLLTLMDNIVTASRALSRPTDGPCTYTLRMGVVTVASIDYWAIIQSWTGTG